MKSKVDGFRGSRKGNSAAPGGQRGPGPDRDAGLTGRAGGIEPCRKEGIVQAA
jgi:hypothetical protein